MKALASYQEIIKYYQKKVHQLAADEHLKKKYIDFRKKFWEIEKNIKMVSEDIYTEALQCEYP